MGHDNELTFFTLAIKTVEKRKRQCLLQFWIKMQNVLRLLLNVQFHSPRLL